MRYDKTKGVTVPFRTRLTMEDAEKLQEISEATGISVCALTEKLIKYGMRHAKFRDVIHKEIYFEDEKP